MDQPLEKLMLHRFTVHRDDTNVELKWAIVV